MSTQIHKQSVDKINKDIGNAIPTCLIAINWKGQCGIQLPVFKRGVKLLGAKPPNNAFTLCICPPPPLSPLPVAAAASATSAVAIGQWYNMTFISAFMLCLYMCTTHACMHGAMVTELVVIINLTHLLMSGCHCLIHVIHFNNGWSHSTVPHTQITYMHVW